jgi:hypothetical protein
MKELLLGLIITLGSLCGYLAGSRLFTWVEERTIRNCAHGFPW